MTTIREAAKAYESRQVLNIADLPEVSPDLVLEEDKFETTDKNGDSKTVTQKVTQIDGEKYRVPNSVLKQLKVYLEENPEMKKFKVKKSGKGLNTDYTVIPIMEK